MCACMQGDALSKSGNEIARSETTDPWYYAVECDDVSSELQDIVSQAKAYKGDRLRDRYVLQMVRALFTSYQYDDCINLWNESRHYFKDNILRKMTVGYVAGAFYHIGNRETSGRLYIESNDMQSAFKCLNDQNLSRFEWMCRYNSDSEQLIQLLQHDIHHFEGWQEVLDFEKDYEELYPYVTRMIYDDRCKNKAPWYYAAAFIADKLDKREKALFYLSKAKETRCDEDLKQSIRVLDFYLTVRYAERYDEDFENYVFHELKRLDDVIVKSLSDSTKEKISKSGLWNHKVGISQYYWNDMMRKIVISELVPLCLRSNYKTRALQYLNMADNRIYNLVTEQYIENEWKYVDRNWVKPDEPYTVVSIENCRNQIDYLNDYFINLDSIGVRYVQRLAYRMEHPICPLDTFLNERSYTDPQYLYDIIGTQLVASMKFAEAIPYLSRVSREFNERRNVLRYCNTDPWSGERLNQPDAMYKLHFAERMYAFDKEARTARSPNDKAEAMLKYAWGLLSSVGDKCWVLTSFYRGSWDCYPFHSQYQKHLRDDVILKSKRIKNHAFTLFTDRERAAQTCFDWMMYKTAATKYKDTKVAKYIHGHCDSLWDYAIVPLHPQRED